jgi:hypothetical protein
MCEPGSPAAAGKDFVLGLHGTSRTIAQAAGTHGASAAR